MSPFTWVCQEITEFYWRLLARLLRINCSLSAGVFYMLSIVGPALGYALGGPFLSIYVDPWEETHLTPSDPGWVGAWWLCFIFCGVASLIISIPFFCYPRHLPSCQEVKRLREKEMAKRSKSRGVGGQKAQGARNQIKEVLKNFLHDVWRVVANPSWIFVTLGIASSILVVSGFASFGPKYVETQFGLPASVASLAVGAVGESCILSVYALSNLSALISNLGIKLVRTQ